MLLTTFLDFLGAHTRGILVLLMLVSCAGVAVQWLAWILGWGRFQNRPEPAGGRQTLRFSAIS